MPVARNIGSLILRRERLIPELEHSGEGNTVVLEKDDLKTEVLQKLVSYTSSITVQEGNLPTVSDALKKTSLRDPQGNPKGFQESGNGQEFFIDSQSSEAASSFSQISNSGQLDNEEAQGGAFRIKKGKSSENIQSGQDILNEVNNLGDQASFVARVKQVQLDNNKYNSDNLFLPPGESALEDDSNIGVGYSQTEFGKYGPRKFPTIEGDTAVKIKLADLKKIGLLSLLQASGEYYIPNDPNDAAQQLGARGSSFAPGLARLGQKITLSNVRPTKIMQDINSAYKKISLDDGIKKDAVKSYGSVNNWLVPFAGLNSTASVASAALLSLTIGNALKRVATLIASRRANNAATSGETTNEVSANPTTEERRTRLGSFIGRTVNQQRSLLETNLDIPQTTHEYFQCVSRGVDIFFGVQNIGVQSRKILDNHGYYNTLLRSVIRNTTDFFKDTLGDFVSPSNGNVGVNDVGVLSNPLGPLEILQRLNNSQLLKFCNILATIGDTALNHEAAGYTLDNDGGVSDVISDIDRIVVDGDLGPDRERSLNPAVLQSVSRLPGQYRNALAWGSNTVKSMYMFPEGIYRGEATYTGASTQANSPTAAVIADLSVNNLHKIKKVTEVQGNRISENDVKAMEEYLEADYMPFYFHDLRTNEIISFHAFLEEANDSFEAEYNETDGYGRIGSVLTYKNTKRNISLGFRVVATNEKDFDHMWWKINKLLTLVYPQYTEGRLVGTSTDKFIQPFSQMPSASPLIRLRLGDVWKSNYSRFGIARLFGVGSRQFALRGQQGQFQYNSTLQRNIEQVTRRMGEQGEYNQGEFAFIRPLFGVGNGSGQRLVGYPRTGDLQDSPTQTGQNIRQGRGGSRGAGINTGFVSLNPNGPPTSITSRGRPLAVQQMMRVQIIRASRTPNGAVRTYRFVVPNPGQNQDGIYACTQYNLQPDPAEIRRVAIRQSNVTPENSATNTTSVITDFFNPEGENGNTIIKAFESTKGKGLAGFIKNIRLDWSNAVWETARHNSRAPMSLRISMDFTPIHDINPGLDSDGFMTAPIYNTGDTMKSFMEMPEERIQNDTDMLNMGRSLLSALPSSNNGNQSGNGGNPIGNV